MSQLQSKGSNWHSKDDAAKKHAGFKSQEAVQVFA
jgi:hypothetical protein